jgi:hypothetical protein
MEKTALCISLLNGEVRAAALRRGAPAGLWQRPEALEELAGFADVARQAAAGTRAGGRHVAVVLAHSRLNHQIIEVPPARGWALDRFLQRRVQHLKTFEGEAAWSCQPALRTKSAEALLLHLCPQTLLDQLAQGCAAAGLQLTRVIPTVAVLSAHLRQLPLESGEVALLAAETGSSTTVVIGGKDGQVCQGRVLPGTWNEQVDRVAVDLNRTISFAKMQYAAPVNSVWLFGSDAATHAATIASVVKLPVKPSPVPYSPYYWAEQAGRLPERDDGNLISLETRMAPQRRRMLTVTSVILLVLAAATLGAAGYLEMLRRGELQTIAKLDTDISRLRQKKTELEAREAELDRKKELVKLVSEQKLPPVPGYFLGYLSDAVPEDLVLTQLRVVRTNDLWSVHLAGTLQALTNPPPADALQRAFTALTNGLVTGPFKLKLTRAATGEAADPARAGSPPEDLTPPVGLEGEEAPQHRFLIEGLMR